MRPRIRNACAACYLLGFHFYWLAVSVLLGGQIEVMNG